jgi:hypothetical protein
MPGVNLHNIGLPQRRVARDGPVPGRVRHDTWPRSRVNLQRDLCEQVRKLIVGL